MAIDGLAKPGAQKSTGGCTVVSDDRVEPALYRVPDRGVLEAGRGTPAAAGQAHHHDQSAGRYTHDPTLTRPS